MNIPDEIDEKFKTYSRFISDSKEREGVINALEYGYFLRDTEIEQLKKENERLKGLIGEAWRQAIRNSEIENGAYESDERYINFRDFLEKNNLQREGEKKKN